VELVVKHQETLVLVLFFYIYIHKTLKMISRVNLLSWIAILASLVPISCNSLKTSEDTSRPNIIIIYADDLGFGDVGCYGAISFNTPGIDRLASEGIRFTQGYAASATCTPSRYGLLTGEYPWRNKRARVLRGDAPLLIDTAMQTLPGILKKAGYTTAVVGKWHLGLGNGTIDWNQRVDPGPNEVGFDYSYIMAATNDRVPTVYLENGSVVGLDPKDPLEVSYKKNFPGEPTGKNNPELLKIHPSHGHDMSIQNGISRIGFMRGGKAALWIDENMADTFLVRAQRFIEENRDRPFFLYYALQQPHVPRTPHPRFAGTTGLGPRGDAIAEADWCVGQILNTIDSLGLANNTLVIFTSDNGPVLDDGYRDDAVEKNGNHKPSGNLRGGKYSLYDAGTHVPFIVRWQGEVHPGVSNALISQIDLTASLASLVNQPCKAPDSEDLLSALTGVSEKGRDKMVVQSYGHKIAYRKENWVLLPSYEGPAVSSYVNIELGTSPEIQLFNLDSDPGQQINLATKFPEKVNVMMKELDDIKK
jgi:arylsulfatase A-like enzyme